MPSCSVCGEYVYVSKYGGKGQAHCPNLRNHPKHVKKRMKEFLKNHTVEELKPLCSGQIILHSRSSNPIIVKKIDLMNEVLQELNLKQ